MNPQLIEDLSKILQKKTTRDKLYKVLIIIAVIAISSGAVVLSGGLSIMSGVSGLAHVANAMAGAKDGLLTLAATRTTAKDASDMLEDAHKYKLKQHSPVQIINQSFEEIFFYLSFTMNIFQFYVCRMLTLCSEYIKKHSIILDNKDSPQDSPQYSTLKYTIVYFTKIMTNLYSKIAERFKIDALMKANTLEVIDSDTTDEKIKEKLTNIFGDYLYSFLTENYKLNIDELAALPVLMDVVQNNLQLDAIQFKYTEPSQFSEILGKLKQIDGISLLLEQEPFNFMITPEVHYFDLTQMKIVSEPSGKGCFIHDPLTHNLYRLIEKLDILYNCDISKNSTIEDCIGDTITGGEEGSSYDPEAQGLNALSSKPSQMLKYYVYPPLEEAKQRTQYKQDIQDIQNHIYQLEPALYRTGKGIKHANTEQQNTTIVKQHPFIVSIIETLVFFDQFESLRTPLANEIREGVVDSMSDMDTYINKIKKVLDDFKEKNYSFIDNQTSQTTEEATVGGGKRHSKLRKRRSFKVKSRRR